MGTPAAALCVALLAFAAAGPAPVPVAPAATGTSFRKAGEGLKDLGRKAGEAGREVGREVAEAARKVWYKGKRVSRPLLEDVQEATHRFWAETLKAKDEALRRLREENQELKRRLAAKRGGG